MSAASMAGVQRSCASTSRLMSLSDLMAISSRVGRESLGEAPKRFFRVLAEEFRRIALAKRLGKCGNINDSVNLPVGGSVTYTVTASIRVDRGLVRDRRFPRSRSGC